MRIESVLLPPHDTGNDGRARALQRPEILDTELIVSPSQALGLVIPESLAEQLFPCGRVGHAGFLHRPDRILRLGRREEISRVRHFLQGSGLASENDPVNCTGRFHEPHRADSKTLSRRKRIPNRKFDHKIESVSHHLLSSDEF